MRAMVLTSIGNPLVAQDVPIPEPNPKQVLIQVSACGVCRTDLHIIDGDLPPCKLPLIPGHQIIGHVVKQGTHVKNTLEGNRVGVPWLGGSCQRCEYCLSGKENLCDQALYTGYQIDGGYAEYCVADASFVLPVAKHFPDLDATPLLCAGLIGYRALRLAGKAKTIGFYGFGSSAHILIQVVRAKGGQVFAFTHKKDFALKLGAAWAGGIEEKPPALMDAAIIFAPVGTLIPLALQAVKKGGSIVCAGIHMSDIPSFPYRLLWEERILRSVANLTREDGKEFLDLAPKIPIHTEVVVYPLEHANQALKDLRDGRISGTAVLKIN
jgi:alcohol dehydrogenase, propanol-preferring